MKKVIFDQKGQLLIEVLLAVLIAVLVIGAAANMMVVSLKIGQVSGDRSIAISLAEEGFETLQAISDSDWHEIYSPLGTGNKGDSYPYYIYKNGSTWAISDSVANGDITVNSIIYTRKIYIYNVYRSNAYDGDREIIPQGGPGTTEDPSTQKIKVVVSYSSGQDVVRTEYITRWKNNTSRQTDWSGGAGQTGPIAIPNAQYSSDDGNIDTNNPAGSIKLKQ